MPINKNRSIAGVVIVIGMLGVFALGGYTAKKFAVNSRATATPPPSTQSAQSSTQPPPPVQLSGMTPSNSGKVDSVEVMIERLRARLEKEPNDVNGWVLLGRSYHYLERWDDAKAAFAKARELGYQGDSENSVNTSAENIETSHATENDETVFNDIGRVGQSSGKNAANLVRVSIDVTSALRQKFPPETPVFVFARAAQGSRMPLAVVRKTLNELPAEMDLDDSLAMMPEAKISTAKTIVLGARIAPSGNPIAQPGDVEVISAPTSNWQGQRIALLLQPKNQ